MSRIIHSRFSSLLVISIFYLSVSACNQNEKSIDLVDSASSWWNNYIPGGNNLELNPPADTIDGTYPIEPIFKDFYQELGGSEILGPAISSAFISGDKTKQYVEAGLLIFDGQRALNDHFILAPLGREFEIVGVAHPENDASDQTPLGRKDVYPAFLSLYEKLGGARFVGRPLTHVRHNPSKERIEQYFENLGFFIHDNDESGEVRLMAYGAYACDLGCRYNVDIGGVPSHQPVLPEPFQTKCAELGVPFTGRTLTEVYTTSENNLEVIFENVVLISSDDRNEVNAKPILYEIGFEKQPLFPPADDPLMVFIPIEEDMGHNVPVFFLDYLQDYGGLDFAGLPISEVFVEEDGIYWQCFNNLCVEFVIAESSNNKIRLAPLGQNYKQKVYDHARNFSESQSLEGVVLKIWEKRMFVSVTDYQEINVNIYQSGIPLANREPILYLTLPDGGLQKSYFPPTDAGGRSMLKLAPFQVSNGTLIAYRVCLDGIEDQQACAGESFLVWNSD